MGMFELLPMSAQIRRSNLGTPSINWQSAQIAIAENVPCFSGVRVLFTDAWRIRR